MVMIMTKLYRENLGYDIDMIIREMSNNIYL